MTMIYGRPDTFVLCSASGLGCSKKMAKPFWQPTNIDMGTVLVLN